MFVNRLDSLQFHLFLAELCVSGVSFGSLLLLILLHDVSCDANVSLLSPPIEKHTSLKNEKIIHHLVLLDLCTLRRVYEIHRLQQQHRVDASPRFEHFG